VDFGKVVHYYFDKLTLDREPTFEGEKFCKLRHEPHEVDPKSDPTLRSKPYLLAIDDPAMRTHIQNEIILNPTKEKSRFSIGKHKNRDIQLNLGAVSNYHCSLEHHPSKGWILHENNKQAQYGMSTNGTYLFMKTVE